MALSTEDLLKLKELLKQDILEDIQADLNAIRDNMATKEQITKVLDVLAKHESYIGTEQQFIIAHIDKHEEEIKMIKRRLGLENKEL